MTVAVRPRRHSILLPVLLLLTGVLLLLFNVGALPDGAGWRLIAVSPLILVMLGLQIVLDRLTPGAAGGALAAVAIALVGLAGLAYVALGPTFGSGTYQLFTSSSPVGDLHAASVQVDAAAADVSIRFADLGPTLYRAQIRYAAQAPKLDYANGELRLSSSNRVGIGWGSSKDQLQLTLSSAVPWTIAVNGAGVSTAVDLRNAQLRSLSLNGVGSDARLSLGTPHGTVPIESAGVAAKLTITVPASVQYRVTAKGIAASVGGAGESGAWASAADRYNVTADGVATQVEVRTR